MQVTTCPECETTFKISDEILAEADGQARCGRCGQVFDARVSLREQAATRTRSIYISDTESRWLFVDPDAAAAADTEAEAETDSEAEAEAETHADANAELTAERPTDPGWPPALEQAGPGRRRLLAGGVTLLALVLAMQVVHASRHTLAGVPVFGDLLAGAYGLLGLERPHRVDLEQYQLLDLAALAEPVTEDEGLLVIETRVRNNGPKIQPAPHIFVALLDRWQDTIAGRYFGPDEYAVDSATDFSAMTAGSTIDAQFIIVDPGPGATGFELQICTPIAQSFACDGDTNFE